MKSAVMLKARILLEIIWCFYSGTSSAFQLICDFLLYCLTMKLCMRLYVGEINLCNTFFFHPGYL